MSADWQRAHAVYRKCLWRKAFSTIVTATRLSHAAALTATERPSPSGLPGLGQIAALPQVKGLSNVG